MTQAKSTSELIKILNQGRPAVIPTDTLYGLVGRADRPATVNQIYSLKNRPQDKPCIILISRLADLKKFSIELTEAKSKLLDRIWPGPVSAILPCPTERFAYLHRGQKSLAFRLPKPSWLREIIAATGPLIAPSANPAGQEPANDLDQAQTYFGSAVFYWTNDILPPGQPSSLIDLTGPKAEIIRTGAGLDGRDNKRY